jgi:AraC family transcriptional regulator
MPKPAAQTTPLTAATGLHRYMPMPPVRTSAELFPGWASMHACLYRLSPGEVSLPPADSLRVVVQLSAKCTTVERSLAGVTVSAHPCLDAININPAYQAVRWHWETFLELIQIQLPESFIRRIAAEHGADADRMLRLERINLHDAFIAQIGHELAAIVEGRHNGVDVEYMDSLATTLALHLAQRYCNGVDAVEVARPHHGADFSRIVEFIHANLGNDLRLEQVARVANLSNFYFIRLFKAQFGKTPHQYILECRIALAQELLRSSFLAISDISQRCGFSTQSHFTNAFHRSTGVSPRAYRQQQAAATEPVH